MYEFNSKKQNLRNTDSQSQVWNFGDIVVKEAGIGDNGIVSQGLDAGAGVEGGSRFVEGNVTIRTDASQEELNTSDGGDLLLITLAFEIQVRGISIEDVDILGENIDVLEEVAPHKGVVRLGMIP